MSLVDEDDHGGTRDVAQGSKLVLRTGVDSREEVREGDRWVFTVCTCALSVLGERGSRGLRREGRDLLVGHADEEVVEGPCQVCRLVQFVRCVYDLAVHVDEEGLQSSWWSLSPDSRPGWDPPRSAGQSLPASDLDDGRECTCSSRKARTEIRRGYR